MYKDSDRNMFNIIKKFCIKIGETNVITLIMQLEYYMLLMLH